MIRSAYAVVRLEHLAHNLNTLRKFAPQSKIMAVVKADAYGHGLVEAARALNQADAFAVACANEALTLRSAGILHPIVCLQGFTDSQQLQQIADANVQAVIHSDYQIKLLTGCKLKQPIQIWLKIDTGMTRLGVAPQNAAKVYQQLLESNRVAKIRVMTHFANADLLDEKVTQHQLKLFEQGCKEIPACEKSTANSAATLAFSNTHYDWVRPGLALYGISPFQAGQSQPDTSALLPAMSLHAPIISIKNCHRGDRIGYGGTYTCQQDMRIAVAALGYADGYPRALTETSLVSIEGNHAPIVGNISMDMITIDVSTIEAAVGDQVEFWGGDISVADVASAANTISYELLCGIAGRVKREYA